MINPNIIHIEKEEVQFLKFPKEDVLSDKTAQKQRCQLLKTAMKLGNLEHQKVQVLFQDNQGLKRIETTIWGVTDKSVILKQSIILPVQRILAVS